MKQRTRIAGIIGLIVLLTVACGKNGLRGADFEIPVYPDAKVTERDTGGFSAGESFSSMDDFDYVAWTLVTKSSVDEVVEFYSSKYPSEVAEALEDTYDPTEVVVNFRAPGMGPEDYVELSIEPGEISIMQITLRQ